MSNKISNNQHWNIILGYSMYIDEDRVEDIFQELCQQLEKITIGELKDSSYRKLEERAYFHESEERRAKEQLSIILNELKQSVIYREINLKKNRAKEKMQQLISEQNKDINK